MVSNKSSNNPYLLKHDLINIGWCNDECIKGIEGSFIDEENKTIKHIVQQGETLITIARYYNTTYNKIAKDNNIANPNKIKIGQELIIIS